MSKKIASYPTMQVGIYRATRLVAKKSKTLGGAPLEIWVVREDGVPVQQVELVRTKGEWWAWTGNFVRLSQKELAHAVAAARAEVL